MKSVFRSLLFVVFSLTGYTQTAQRINLPTATSCVDSVHQFVYKTWIGKNPLHNDSLYLYFSKNKVSDTVNNKRISLMPVSISAFVSKLNRLLSIAYNKGDNRFTNRIYISWSDSRYGKNESDVFVTYSDDFGENWTDPILLTYHPNHSKQFSPTLIVNNKTGEVCVYYFDQQNYIQTDFTDMMLAKSNNGGLKWCYFKLNKEPLSLKKLKYTVVQHDTLSNIEIVHNQKTSSVTVTESYLDEAAKRISVTEMSINKSFDYSTIITIPFVCKSNMLMAATITKPLEPTFRKLIFENKEFKAGKNELSINCKRLGIVKGNYVLTLYFNNKNTYVWITE